MPKNAINVAIGGKADMVVHCTCLLMTQSGHRRLPISQVSPAANRHLRSRDAAGEPQTVKQTHQEPLALQGNRRPGL